MISQATVSNTLTYTAVLTVIEPDARYYSFSVVIVESADLAMVTTVNAGEHFCCSHNQVH